MQNNKEKKLLQLFRSIKVIKEVLNMLKPAICYKEQIDAALMEYFYSNEMMYYSGSIHSNLIEVNTESDGGHYEWAIVSEDGESLTGYICYTVDYYSSCVYNFGLFSFDKGNVVNGAEAFKLIEELINRHHRVEFRAVSGNPATRGYDAFLKKHSDIGKKYVFRDVFKDIKGNYHDDYVYEFINKNN